MDSKRLDALGKVAAEFNDKYQQWCEKACAVETQLRDMKIGLVASVRYELDGREYLFSWYRGFINEKRQWGFCISGISITTTGIFEMEPRHLFAAWPKIDELIEELTKQADEMIAHVDEAKKKLKDQGIA